MRSLKPTSPALEHKMPHLCSLNRSGVLVALSVMTVMQQTRESRCEFVRWLTPLQFALVTAGGELFVPGV